MMHLAIPSPTSPFLDIGPLAIRYYALSIVLGVIIAVFLGSRRAQKVGAPPTLVSDVALLAIPFGVIGGRVYHVISTPDPYFGANGDLLSALYIWEGGLGIWGAISLGFFGAWLAFNRYKEKLNLPLSFAQFADALAPGILLAQVVGRFGNWFNQELFGKPTTLPWALEISPRNRPFGYSQFETFHPTFLYEAIWSLALALILIALTQKLSAVPGRIFALYVAGYCLGRLFIEQLRIDSALLFLGFRLNTWTSLAVLALALLAYIRLAKRSGSQTQSQDLE
jgi:prolipoprotein diacylglyceryl transferase